MMKPRNRKTAPARWLIVVALGGLSLVGCARVFHASPRDDRPANETGGLDETWGREYRKPDRTLESWGTDERTRDIERSLGAP